MFGEDSEIISSNSVCNKYFTTVHFTTSVFKTENGSFVLQNPQELTLTKTTTALNQYERLEQSHTIYTKLIPYKVNNITKIN